MQRLKKKEKMKQGLFLSVPEAGRIRCVKDWNGYRVKVESLTERPKGERERPRPLVFDSLKNQIASKAIHT